MMIVKNLNHLAAEKKVTIGFEPFEEPFIRTDKEMFSIIMQHIIHNILHLPVAPKISDLHSPLHHNFLAISLLNLLKSSTKIITSQLIIPIIELEESMRPSIMKQIRISYCFVLFVLLITIRLP